MHGIATIAVLGLTLGCLASGATAQPISSKFLDDNAKFIVERAVNSIPLVESKVQAAAFGHDADPTDDVLGIKVADLQLNSKFTAVSKIGAKSGVALAGATEAGVDATDPRTSPEPTSKFLSAGIPSGIRAGHDPTTENSATKQP
jgi:hypothetical protein